MAYTYEISFNISSEPKDLLEVGSALERGVGYMRTMLPSEPGFMYARAMYSLARADVTRVIFHSVWETWEDLVAHRNTYLEEKRLLTEEFEPRMNVDDLVVNYYAEVP